MASPLSYGSVTTWPQGPGAGTDAVTSLATTVTKGLGTVDTGSTPAYDLIIPPCKFKTGAASWTTGNTIDLYLITSEDNAIFTDGISPTATSSVTSSINSATLLQSIPATANATTYYSREFSVVAALGFLPRYCALLLKNNGAGSLDSTAGNHSAKYLVVSFA